MSLLLITGLCISLAVKSVSASQEARQFSNQIDAHQKVLKRLKQRLQGVRKQKYSTEKQLKSKIKTERKLKSQIEDLQEQLQARAEVKSSDMELASYVEPLTRSNCGDNHYAAYIYGMESGGRVSGNCSTTDTNSNGCYGIGQDCNGIVQQKCGANYSCQNEYFSSYAISRYGSWEKAYNFWIANGWW